MLVRLSMHCKMVTPESSCFAHPTNHQQGELDMDNAKHDTVLDAGSVKARLAKVYAEALLAAAERQNAVDATGDELSHFVSDVLDAAPEVESFLASPVVGKKAKAAALDAALPGRFPISCVDYLPSKLGAKWSPRSSAGYRRVVSSATR